MPQNKALPSGMRRVGVAASKIAESKDSLLAGGDYTQIEKARDVMGKHCSEAR
jgi:hypothetical protein